MKNFDLEITKTSDIIQRERPFICESNSELLDHLHKVEVIILYSIKTGDKDKFDFGVHISSKLISEAAYRN